MSEARWEVRQARSRASCPCRSVWSMELTRGLGAGKRPTAEPHPAQTWVLTLRILGSV